MLNTRMPLKTSKSQTTNAFRVSSRKSVKLSFILNHISNHENWLIFRAIPFRLVASKSRLSTITAHSINYHYVVKWNFHRLFTGKVQILLLRLSIRFDKVWLSVRIQELKFVCSVDVLFTNKT